ncbi:MAG: haloacid dehalogenase, partial [Chloroflexi bacterium]|nr:haloacid dehalogenase [Chloroflexota bacterium]
MSDRWVCLDVGETLIDETRIWSIWADELGVPRLTFLAALGAVIARGGEHRDVFPMFGADDWPLRLPSVEATYGGFRAEDLYPDALPALEALRQDHRLAIIAN